MAQARRVRFLRDFRGRLTGEAFFYMGEEAITEKHAELVEAGICEYTKPAAKPKKEAKQ